MTHRHTLIALMLGMTVLLGFSVPAIASTACTLDTAPYWDGSYTLGYSATAQLISPQAACPMLVEYAFELARRKTPGNVTFTIYQWGPSGPVGAALFTSTLPWGTSKTVIMVSNINLTLTPGIQYGIDIDLQGYGDRSVAFTYDHTGYRGGDGWWYNGNWSDVPGTNHKFRAKWAAAAN